jgi:hypothetical protein
MYIHVYLAEFFLKLEMFRTKVVDKIKSDVLCSVTFFRKSYRLRGNVEKYGTAKQATEENKIRRMRFACWMTKATDTHSDYVIVLFDGNNVYAKAIQCYVYTYNACLVEF